LRPIDLDDAAARQPAEPERDVEAERARRDDVDVARRDRITQAHDRALAKLLLDLAQGCNEGFLTIVVHAVSVRSKEWIRERRRVQDALGLFHRTRGAAAAFSGASHGYAHALAMRVAMEKRGRTDFPADRGSAGTGQSMSRGARSICLPNDRGNRPGPSLPKNRFAPFSLKSVRPL